MGTFTAEDHDKLIQDGKLPPIEEEREEPINEPDIVVDDEEEEDDTDVTAEAEDEEDAPQAAFLDGDDVPEALRGKSRAEVLAYIQEMQNVTSQFANVFAQTQQQRPPAPVPEEEEDVTLSNDDLLEADALTEKINKLIEAKNKPYLQSVANMTAQQNYKNAFERFPYLADYKDEFAGMASQLTVEAMANPQTAEILAGRVLQNHLDEITKKRTARGGKPRPPDTPGTQGKPAPPGKGKVRLTREEKRVADALGVSHAAYATMKAQVNQ